MIAVIDYGVGNLFSLVSSLKAIGADAVVTGDIDTVMKADKIILPGVGAFEDAAKKLFSSGLADVVIEQVALGKPLMGVFTDTESLVELSYKLMCLLAVGYIAVAVTQSLSGIMRGAGDTVTPMWISLITTIAIRIPIAYGISFLTRTEALPYGQKECIQISLLISWIMGAVLTVIFYRMGKWKNKAINRK